MGKRGLGRPKEYPDRKPTMINIQSNIKEEMEEIAARENKSLSQKIND